MPKRLCEFPLQPVGADADGRRRFVANPVVLHLLDRMEARRPGALQRLREMQEREEWSVDAMEQFYQLIGCSVDGFFEVFPRTKQAGQIARALKLLLEGGEIVRGMYHWCAWRPGDTLGRDVEQLCFVCGTSDRRSKPPPGKVRGLKYFATSRRWGGRQLIEQHLLRPVLGEELEMLWKRGVPKCPEDD